MFKSLLEDQTSRLVAVVERLTKTLEAESQRRRMFDNEFFVIQLDNLGISCSTRSACNVGSELGSHVIISLGKGEKKAKESVRFTLGRNTVKKDIDYTLNSIKKLLNK